VQGGGVSSHIAFCSMKYLKNKKKKKKKHKVFAVQSESAHFQHYDDHGRVE
jgi:hypothetical protein